MTLTDLGMPFMQSYTKYFSGSTPTTAVPAPIVTTPVPRGPVVSIVSPGTTIAPTVLDPLVAVVGVDPEKYLVYDCIKGVPRSVKVIANAG